MADPWASVSDVSVITGEDVSDQQLAQAQGVIELLVGRTPEANLLMRAADLRWLMRAVAWQAAWLKAKPDLTSQTDVNSVSQDGAQADLKPDALILAPLARRALKRLSWRGNRSVFTPSTFQRTRQRAMPGSEGVVEILENTDADDNWKRL